MRLFLGITSVCLAFVALAAFGIRGEGNPANGEAAAPAEGRFVVHEWGTFTSFAGSNGVKLEFRPLEEHDLPPFVFNRERQAGAFNPFSKFNAAVLQRMETPITYFYSDRARQVNVRVKFPQGLLTEFYPPVESMEPALKPAQRTDDRPPLANSLLDWGSVWIVPEDALQADVASDEIAGRLRRRMVEGLLPSSAGYPHYAHARDTDSALVYIDRPFDAKKSLVRPNAAGEFFEKFLFYRGIGNFDLPLRLKARPKERFELTNLGREPIRSLFLVTVDERGLRFVHRDVVQPGEQTMLIQSTAASSEAELAEAIVAALVAENLYEKEARAMVQTWRSSWFAEPGSRLFYLLPQTMTDELLPLEIEPRPDEMVRVMVGRLEILRPEDETRIEQLIKESALARANALAGGESGEKAMEETPPQAMMELGRFAEPALLHVQSATPDEVVRNEAQRLLDALRRHRGQ